VNVTLLPDTLVVTLEGAEGVVQVRGSVMSSVVSPLNVSA
jgi:hypothetical protein